MQKLGLKRGLDREQVISPYASFLALSISHESAVKNLRRLRNLGMEGTYGFFEACDFTASRLPGQKEYAVVRCFMAHHLGMSMISISNLIAKASMTDRFMRDTRMRAYQVLLCEKIPIGAPVIRVISKEVPEKPKLAPSGRRPGILRQGAQPCGDRPSDERVLPPDADGGREEQIGERQDAASYLLGKRSVPFFQGSGFS